ncbi:hypothetical protein [Paenibacillus sp. HW567]|uniref:hypothetical protein n=1 Tax=Paenibacillus sp. HW567 TaxID=1034769 RepID=UPI0003787C7F|nr:hypothetical protein [Paenibacillus sp. HW567]
MSAFAEFDKERQEIDALLRQDYTITGIREGLDGAKVKFISSASGRDPVELLLLTADARKHVTTLLIAAACPPAPVETHS